MVLGTLGVRQITDVRGLGVRHVPLRSCSRRSAPPPLAYVGELIRDCKSLRSFICVAAAPLYFLPSNFGNLFVCGESTAEPITGGEAVYTQGRVRCGAAPAGAVDDLVQHRGLALVDLLHGAQAAHVQQLGEHQPREVDGEGGGRVEHRVRLRQPGVVQH
eukprot:1181706-Prorocentrum_minimum.AAC.1